MSTRGVLSALAAYLMWGFMPLYWKLLDDVPAPRILAHRIVWSFVFSALLVLTVSGPKRLSLRRGPRLLGLYAASGAVIGINWLLFIWAVTNEHVLEASLGYFLNPLLTVLLGAWLFHEHLNTRRRVAVGLAAAGALYLVARAHTAHLSVAFALAFTFSIYGVLRKRAPLPSLDGMYLETVTILPWGLAYLVWLREPVTPLLVGTGVVTMLPLLFFSDAAQRLPLSALGMFQYLSPTFQFLLAVVAYHEPFSVDRLVGFSLIWAGLAVYALFRR